MTIKRVLFNGQDVVNHEQAISFIAELVQANEGDFEFQRGTVARGPHELSINEVLFSSLAMIDEIKAYQQHFPDSETVFIPTDNGRKSSDPELMGFLEKIYPQLEEGTNALAIQAALGLYLDQVLLRLYKLRALGIIVPKRIFELAAVEPAPPPPIKPGTVPLPFIREPVAPAQTQSPKPARVHIYQPKQTVLRHLMTSVWNMVAAKK